MFGEQDAADQGFDIQNGIISIDGLDQYLSTTYMGLIPEEILHNQPHLAQFLIQHELTHGGPIEQTHSFDDPQSEMYMALDMMDGVPDMQSDERMVQPPPRKIKLDTCKCKSSSQCPICLLIIKKNSRIPSLMCGHPFHGRCLSKWIKKQANCPLCRLDLSRP